MNKQGEVRVVAQTVVSTSQVRSVSKLVRGVQRFGAFCTACEMLVPPQWSTAGCVSGWALAHLNLDPYDSIPVCSELEQ